MSRAGETSKPCHGCGQPGRRPAEELCYRCRRIFEAGQRAIAAEAEAAKPENGPRCYRMPAARWWPHFSEGSSNSATYPDDLGRAFGTLALSLGPAPVRVPGYGEVVTIGNDDNRHDWWQYRLVLPATVEALLALERETRKALIVCAADAVQHGRNLLGQLARGEITADTFDKPTRPEEATR